MRGQPFVTADFKDGVNRDVAPYSISSSQAQDVLNVVSTSMGAVRKRNGFRPLVLKGPENELVTRRPEFLTPDIFNAPFTSLMGYEKGSIKYLVAVADDDASVDMFLVNPGGAYNSIKGNLNLTPTRRWESVQAPAISGQGPLYLINGIDDPLQWDGSGNVSAWTALSGTVPNGKYIVYHDNRVLVAGVETDYTTRSTLYSSSIADPRTWASPDGATNLFDPEDGEDISALGTVGPYALVFKPTKTFVVTDTDSLGYRNISDNIGCVANRSVVNTDSGTFFLTADRRICVTDGSSITHISEAIDPLLRDISASGLSNAAAVFANNRYYLSIARNDLNNDTILEFDIRNASWWIHKIQLTETEQHGVNDWCLLDPDGAATLYSIGANPVGRVYESFVAGRHIDDVRFQSHWTTGWDSFGSPHLRKIVTGVRADHKGSVTMSWATSFSGFGQGGSVDDRIEWETSADDSGIFGGEGSFGGEGIYGGTAEVTETRWYTLGTARAWAFKFENNQNQDWELYSYTVGVEQRND